VLLRNPSVKPFAFQAALFLDSPPLVGFQALRAKLAAPVRGQGMAASAAEVSAGLEAGKGGFW